MRTRNVDFVLVGITESNPPVNCTTPKNYCNPYAAQQSAGPLLVPSLNITAIPTRPSEAPAPW